MQVLRSSSSWSTGVHQTEKSILNCYISMILSAERFIYIENQFFISSVTKQAKNNSVVRNRIVKALYKRIKQAIHQKQNFKVVVFIPLMPAFEANLEKEEGRVMQVQIGLENHTIGIGPWSLLEKLKHLTDTPEEYIMFCSLRKFEEPPFPNATPKTNLIYIHSKVSGSLIVS